ncbi:hypothetical protein ASD67_10260 [Sphingopyxis sp. Root1497]|uniref:DUF2339 domain-containing protein n=1 Tax=Sphingopyxis sp. Root1497 TaxID=1736474 RepID=UPI0006FF0537|nr:DUF2339 domain-containing protein [Sphingopyxis sp. Root1497]KQZ64805.1 hypothetical protein ASD67_10260 [Sphingopyxis sp. Root1497]
MAGFFAFVAIVILFLLLIDTRGRLKRAEATLQEAAKRIGALQRHAGLLPPKPGETPSQARAAAAAPLSSQPVGAPRPVPAAPPPSRSPWAPPSPETLDRWKPKIDEPAPAQQEEAPEPVAPPQDEAPAPIPVPEEKIVPAAAAVAAASAPLPAVSEPVPDEELTEEEEAGETAAAAPADADTEASVPEPEAEPVAARAAAPPPKPPAPPAPPASMAQRFENLFGKTLPIWAGGITLAIAGVLIVRYAIDAGFFARVFTPGVQVIAGVLFGLGLIGGAEYAWRNEDKVRDLRVPQALSGAGIATLYAAILVAANVYGLIGPLAAFVGLAAVTAAALGLSLRFGPPSALLGLAGGLAAPALVGAMQPNVPLLAVYLGLTIAGLTGVSRMKRWPWLALAALVGGVGWSLWMVLATSALDTLGSLSIGGFVLLLALALPMLAFDGPRAAVLRAGSAIVGALQLALLVGYGGFAPLHWGLFALLAAAGQWLAWREKDFAIVPSISLALSVMLLAVWPDPSAYWFTLIGLALASIHALPLLARLWSVPKTLRRTLELCALLLAAVPLTKYHFWHIADATLALVALGGVLLAGAGIARGWKVEDRAADTRFAWLTATGGILLALAILLVLPHWMAPFAIGGVAAALLFFGKAAKDRRIEPIAAAFVGAALVSLVATPLALAELPRLVVGAGDGFATQALLRWAGLAALLALFAGKAEDRFFRAASLAIAGGLAYGMLAQIVPGWSLTLAMGAVTVGLFLLARRGASLPVELLSAGFGLLALMLLAATGPNLVAQWSRLFGSDAVVGATDMIRWAGMTALLALFAAKAGNRVLRFAALAVAGALTYGTLAQVVPGWSLPLAMGAVAMTLFAIARRRASHPVELLSLIYAQLAVLLLAGTGPHLVAQWTRLYGSDAGVGATEVLRWAGLAFAGLAYALWSDRPIIRRAGQVAAALLAYGAFAQVIPGAYLMLVPAIGGATVLLAARRIALLRVDGAAASFVALSLAWAALPVAAWAVEALMSIAGQPMLLESPMLAVDQLLLRLLVPAALFAAPLWLIREHLPRWLLLAGLATAGVVGGIAVHCLYRLGFASAFGGDFVATGVGQRLVWEALLIGGGWLAMTRRWIGLARPLVLAGTAHAVWYGLMLHNPLWAEQAVGGWPVANWLVPLFLLPWLGFTLIGRLFPGAPAIYGRAVQLITMLFVAGFAWATLRQLFHPALLNEPGVTATENILRSILILGLAIGFLLWGIRKGRHDWRIASLILMLGAVGKVFLFDASGLEGLLRIGSFVVLGFSLIGIGWLYSRQLARPAAEDDGKAA